MVSAEACFWSAEATCCVATEGAQAAMIDEISIADAMKKKFRFNVLRTMPDLRNASITRKTISI
jgi:hypothetical protein